MSTKPIFIDSTGVFAQIPDGTIINVGGTDWTSFTVAGRGLMFDDGTSTSPGGSTIDLQTVYNNSTAISGQAAIKLSNGKDLAITNITSTSTYFKVDSETGKVTISGDLEVLGNTTTIETTVTDADHWLISPHQGTTTALKIEPDVGVTPSVDIVSVRRLNAQTPVFRIDKDGNIIATQNMTITGTINGVDIAQLKSDFDAHVDGTGTRHIAEDIDIVPILTLPGAANVQQALEQIDAKVESYGAQVRGFEFIKTTASITWTITHNLASTRAMCTIYNTAGDQIIPDRSKIVDANTMEITFTEAITGRAVIFAF